MNFKIQKIIGVVILSLLLVLSGTLLWKIYQYDISFNMNSQMHKMFINKYTIRRQKLWNQAFSKATQNIYKNIDIQEKGHTLLIDHQYLAEIDHEGQHYDQQTISNAFDISNKALSSKFFLIRSEINQLLFYASKESIQTENTSNSKFYHLEKCLQLDNINIKQKLHYFVDDSDNFWLVSHPHNNLLLIQVYNCHIKKLIKKIQHQPQHQNRKYMLNQLLSISKSDENSYEVKLLVYQSHHYTVKISNTYEVESVYLTPTYQINSERIYLEKTSSDSNSAITFAFVDPYNKIIEEQFNKLFYYIFQWLVNELSYFLELFDANSRLLKAFIDNKLKGFDSDIKIQDVGRDIQVIDEYNGCLVNLEYSISQNSSQRNSFMTRLSKYILDTRTPIFHSIQNYDRYDMAEILSNNKTPPICQFKRLETDQGYNKEYHSHYAYSIYQTFPNSRIHFVAISEKLLYFHPKENIGQNDYLTVRSKTGAIVFQSANIKGSYEDKPLSKYQEFKQDFFIEGNQVLPGIFQAHKGYQSLFSIFKGKKVELMNGLNGKTMISHEIHKKDGYQYVSSSIINNQWWIIQYNKNTKLSDLIKYELYVNKNYPKQIDYTKRVYGNDLQSDDFSILLKQYRNTINPNGVIILEIFRCLDDYYYIEICDTTGDKYAIARVHYKKFSNRQPRADNKYKNDLERSLIVKPKDMVQTLSKVDPFLVVLEGKPFFEGIEDLIKLNVFSFKNYSRKLNNEEQIISKEKKLNRFNYLPFSVLSKQNISTLETESTTQQDIWLVNMRSLIENGKEIFYYETKKIVKTRLIYLGIFICIILISLIAKLSLAKPKIEIKRDKEASLKQNKKKLLTKKSD